MNNTKKIAFCSMIAALGSALMFLSGVVSIATYALPAIVGALFILIVIEFSRSSAFIAYVVVSILSLFIAQDKKAVALFILFFGYYPILKELIESLKNKVIQYVLKFTIFNVAMLLSFFVFIKLLLVPIESFYTLGLSLPILFLVFGNLVFWLYDFALSGFITAYIARFQKIVKKIMHL